MRATFQNAGTVLSIGVFFSLMIAGLARSLPATLGAGLTAAGRAGRRGRPRSPRCRRSAALFAAFLGVEPGAAAARPGRARARCPPDKAAELTGQSFFPGLISGPFHYGLVVVFTAAVVMSVIAAAVSLARGKRYVHTDRAPEPQASEVAAATAR